VRIEAVVVVKPGGQNFEAPAKCNLSHLNLSDPKIAIDRLLRVTITLPNNKTLDAKRRYVGPGDQLLRRLDEPGGK
jgi:hypothetical protein